MLPTKKMENEIKNKEKLVKELHTKLDKLLEKELYEKNERTNIITKMEKESDKKLTDKTKQAEADFKLSETISDIETLKNEISKIKRNIELCNDKISLYKYQIKEKSLIN